MYVIDGCFGITTHAYVRVMRLGYTARCSAYLSAANYKGVRLDRKLLLYTELCMNNLTLVL